MIKTKTMLNSALSKLMAAVLLFLITSIPVANASVKSYKKEANGLLFTLDKGLMKVTICKDDIIEVKYTIFNDFDIAINDLAYFDSKLSKWVIEPGQHQLMAASSSKDIRQTITFNIK